MGKLIVKSKGWVGEDILLLAAAYFFCGAFGLSFASINKSASPIWPPAGLALAVLILKGKELWPGVFLGAFLINISTQGTVWTALGIATGNTLEAYSGAWLVCRYAGGSRAFDRIPNIFGLAFLSGIMSTALGATFGVTSLCLGHLAQWTQFASIWITWWLGDMVSILTVAPLVMLWMRRPLETPKLRQIPEAIALLISVLLVGRIAFLGKNPFGGLNQPLEYMAILPLLWAAFRFGARGAITTAAIMSAIALYGTRRGMGPFALLHPNESMLMLQAFMGTITVTSLVLAIIISDRRRAEQRLQVQDAVSRVLAEAATIEEATPAIFQALCEKGDWEMGAIWDVDRPSNSLYCIEVWRVPSLAASDFEKLTREFRFSPGMGLPGRVWASGRPAWVPDVADDDNFPRAAAAIHSGIHAAVCFPIKLGNEVLGIIECFSRYVRGPDQNFVQMLAGIGLQLGQFIERKRADDARSRLAAIVESSIDAVYSITLDGNISTWNPGAERMFGFAASEVIGKPISTIIPSEHAHEEPAMLERIKLGEKIEHYQTVRVTKDGTRLDISLSVSPMKGPTGKVLGASNIARDITEDKRTERALSETREMLRQHAETLERRVRERTAELQETVRSLDSFCYSIAHDLRAPLRAMSGFGSELMEQYGSRLDDAGKEYLARIRTAAARMDRLICDLLELGRLGTMEVPAEPVELQDVVTKALVPLEKELEKKHADVHLKKPLLPVRASSVMLEQVLVNLLGNAVKFVPPKSRPHVEVWSEARGSMVRVCVRDNGIGMKPEHIKKLFQPFTRLVNGVDYPGTGIGLAIVRKGVERMGGRVGVQSELGKGSCFWIELPAVVSPETEVVC
jgi:PAS domain S-box-containing protein